MEMDAEVTMTRPRSRSASTKASVAPSRWTMAARARAVLEGVRRAASIMPPTPSPLARIPHRGACNRGTCPGSRRRAKAARCRRPAHRLLQRAAILGRADPAQRIAHQLAVASDEHGVTHFAAESRRKGREVLVLAIAARD